jgi:hypothetical protein
MGLNHLLIRCNDFFYFISCWFIFFLIKGEIDGVYITLKTSYSVNIYYDKGIIYNPSIYFLKKFEFIYIYIYSHQ